MVYKYNFVSDTVESVLRTSADVMVLDNESRNIINEKFKMDISYDEHKIKKLEGLKEDAFNRWKDPYGKDTINDLMCTYFNKRILFNKFIKYIVPNNLPMKSLLYIKLKDLSLNFFTSMNIDAECIDIKKLVQNHDKYVDSFIELSLLDHSIRQAVKELKDAEYCSETISQYDVSYILGRYSNVLDACRTHNIDNTVVDSNSDIVDVKVIKSLMPDKFDVATDRDDVVASPMPDIFAIAEIDGNKDIVKEVFKDILDKSPIIGRMKLKRVLKDMGFGKLSDRQLNKIMINLRKEIFSD